MATPPVVLVVDRDPDLQDLESLILADSGYRVEVPPTSVDPLVFAERICPSAIVVGIRPNTPDQWQLVDLLRTRKATRGIPVVVVSTEERITDEATASPNVRETIVAPYDVDALVQAVGAALGNPPPAAVLPPAAGAVPLAFTFAGDALLRSARSIVMRTLVSVHRYEPYRSRFRELSKDLIDNLGTILGAIAGGLQRALASEQLSASPAMQRAIGEHVTLRQSQNIGPSNAIREYQALRGEVGTYVGSLVGTNGFTADDAFHVMRQVDDYVSELVRLVVAEYVDGNRRP